MSRERWEQLERIFLEARQLPHASRAPFVASARKADDWLRAEALSLLAADDESSDFLETTALEGLARALASGGGSLQPAERVGAYTVAGLLGTGGSGEVWRARDERLGRDVAIKVLLRHATADGDRLRRFADEARAAGALNRANIVTVYDVGEHRGIPFLVRECLEGRTLRTQLQAGPLPPDPAVDVAIGMAHGLAAAHARGIIHRNLKPDNVFIRDAGGVKILDFGAAKLQPEPEAERRGTLSGVIGGTARYMAPEQARGEPVDARADLFAFGITAYEMLAGQHPFGGASTFETLHAILTATPEDLASVNPGVPLPLARIVMRRHASNLPPTWPGSSRRWRMAPRVPLAGARSGTTRRPRR